MTQSLRVEQDSRIECYERLQPQRAPLLLTVVAIALLASVAIGTGVGVLAGCNMTVIPLPGVMVAGMGAVMVILHVAPSVATGVVVGGVALLAAAVVTTLLALLAFSIIALATSRDHVEFQRSQVETIEK